MSQSPAKGFSPARPAKSQSPGQARAAGIDLGSLGQLSGPGWLDHCLSPYAAYAAIGSPGADAASGPADLTTTDPLVQASLQRPAQNRTALTLSAPIAGSGDLILAARRPCPATGQRVQVQAQTSPARQKPIYRHSWFRSATKSPAFALSSAAINGLMLVSPLVSFAETTTYGTGSSSGTTYTGGIISSGDTVILNDGATVSGATPITANGTLQFNQTTNLTITNVLTGTGSLALINTGNLTLTYNDTITGPFSPDRDLEPKFNISAFDLGISLAQGSLLVGANGENSLAIGNVSSGSLTIGGGTVQNKDGYLGLNSYSIGTANVSTGGAWTTTGDLFIGYAGNGSLTVSGGTVSNVNSVIGALRTNGSDDLQPGNPDYIPAGNGTVTISGGNWTNTGKLSVGDGGTGTLTVSGGNVSSVGAAINYDSAATISGGNWTNSGDLYIATNNSTLTITGGLVTVAGLLNKMPTGTINLNAGGSLSIGAGGATGELTTYGSSFTYNGTLIFNRTTPYLYNGILDGSGSLVKEGSNVLTLTGNNTYSGTTTINAGTLRVQGSIARSSGLTVNSGAKLSVNGSIASSANLTVNAGAIIGGNGTLPATTIQSGGYLAPGNSIGQLTLGSLSFSGILGAEFQGPQNDKTTVTGSVTNFTGSANLSPYGGGTPWPNFDYQLITATNNFATSSSLTLNPVGITSALLLKGTTLVQEADGNAKTFDVMWRPNNGSGATASAMAALGQGNRNQLAASGVFDSAFRRLASAAGDASGLTTGLNATGSAIGSTGFTTGQAAAAGLSPEFLSTTAQLLGISSNSQLTAAISTITPESYAAFQSVGLETLQRQRQQLLASAGQCASTGWVINGPTSKAAKAPKNPICLYGQAANANSSINGQDGLSSYNANLFSSFYGLEVKANPYWRFGAAYGYGTSNLNGLGPTNAWVTATVNSGSLYGVYTPTTSSPWTFKGLLGYGNYALNGSRQVAVIGTGTPITGSTTANGLTAALTAEVAIPLTKPSAPVPVLLKPLIGIAYGNYQQAGFSETGGGPLNLNVDGNSASSLIGTIGLELTSGPIPLNKAQSISLIPKLALAYQVDALAGELGNSSLSASMPASGSGSFLTQGQNRGVNGFSIAAGADLALSRSTALYGNVNVEAFSSGNQVGYGGGFRYKF